MKKDIVAALHKNLQKRKQTDINNPVISEVKGLLEYDTLRDTEVLRSIGESSSLVQSENERGRMLELEKHEKFYNGAIFRKEEIVGLAAKYRLKFLPSVRFVSYINPLVATDVRDLERSIAKSMDEDQASKRNLTLEEYLASNEPSKFRFDAYELKQKFHILAPAKCFKTEKKSAFTLRVPDPILFYSPDGVHYRFLRKWGKDFTIFRRIKGVVFESKTSMLLSTALVIAIIAALFGVLVASGFFFLNLLCIPATIITYVGDWDKDFFGSRFVSSTSSY